MTDIDMPALRYLADNPVHERADDPIRRLQPLIAAGYAKVGPEYDQVSHNGRRIWRCRTVEITEEGRGVIRRDTAAGREEDR